MIIDPGNLPNILFIVTTLKSNCLIHANYQVIIAFKMSDGGIFGCARSIFTSILTVNCMP